MSFQVIAGSGHCGTMWLARVLDSVPGQRWYHELREVATGLPWNVADGYDPDDPVFDEYWSWVRYEMEYYEVFGDSNSWPPEALPAVNRVMPIDQVIYLTRDKEDQLHSITNHSPVWSAEEYPHVAHKRLYQYWRIAGEPDPPWPWNWPYEKRIRLLVEANDFMPDWLREQSLTVDVYSLEELTTDIGKLRELAPLTDVELQAWQKRDINKKVPA